MAQFQVYGTYTDQFGNQVDGFYWVYEPDPDTTTPVEQPVDPGALAGGQPPGMEASGAMVPIEGATILGYYENPTNGNTYSLVELSVDYVGDDGTTVLLSDVLTYDPNTQCVDADTTTVTDDGSGTSTPFDDFQQYYDDDDTPQYDATGCGASIGIRG